MTEAELREDGATAVDDAYTQVLCGCGWGNLKVRMSELPSECPLCGYQFTADELF